MNKSEKACEEGRWHLHLWDPSNPDDHGMRIPWFCRSWRHVGECRRWKGAEDFDRVVCALEENEHWTYMVLSLPQKRYKTKWSMFRAGLFLWAALRKRIKRKFKSYQYIQTWERHLKGGPHVNIVISSAPFQRACEKVGNRWRNPWLEKNAQECGFGWWYGVKPMFDSDGLAWYLTKLSQELTGAENKGQVPTNAPPHFRRLRASRNTLPPILRGNLTGRLVWAPIDKYIQTTTMASSDVINPIHEGGVNLDADECNSQTALGLAGDGCNDAG